MISNKLAAAAAGLVIVSFGLSAADAIAQASSSNPYPSYPTNATPVNNGSNFTTTAASLTLPGASAKKTYACGFAITSGGTTTAVVGTATLSGINGTSLAFSYVFVSSGQGALGVPFPQCIPASAASTAITLNVTAGSTGTVGSIAMWGYRQ